MLPKFPDSHKERYVVTEETGITTYQVRKDLTAAEKTDEQLDRLMAFPDDPKAVLVLLLRHYLTSGMLVRLGRVATGMWGFEALTVIALLLLVPLYLIGHQWSRGNRFNLVLRAVFVALGGLL
jgi:hypothetical protein